VRATAGGFIVDVRGLWDLAAQAHPVRREAFRAPRVWRARCRRWSATQLRQASRSRAADARVPTYAGGRSGSCRSSLVEPCAKGFFSDILCGRGPSAVRPG
jgi:hypothetical protein